MPKKDQAPHRTQLGIDRSVEQKHDYRQDTAFEGRRLVRLPDRSLCYADEYEERLKEYERNQGSD